MAKKQKIYTCIRDIGTKDGTVKAGDPIKASQLDKDLIKRFVESGMISEVVKEAEETEE